MYKKRTTKLRTDPLADRGSLDPVTAFGERFYHRAKVEEWPRERRPSHSR